MGMASRKQWDRFRKILKKQSRKYRGKFVAMVDEDVVGVGSDQYVLFKRVTKKIPKSKPVGLYYIPTKKEMMVLLWNTLILK